MLLHRKKDWMVGTQNSSYTCISIFSATLGTAFKSIWKQSHFYKFSHCSIVLAWSFTAFKLIKVPSQKMKTAETSRRISQHFLCLFLSTDNISLEWELKLESLLSGRTLEALSLSNLGDRYEAEGMNQAEVKEKKTCCVKRLSVLMKMLHFFFFFFVKKESQMLWHCFCWGLTTHWCKTVSFDTFIILIQYMPHWVHKRIYSTYFFLCIYVDPYGSKLITFFHWIQFVFWQFFFIC